MRLADFLAEIGRSGGEAAHAASQYSELRMLNLFKLDEDGTLHPQTLPVCIGNKIVEVPRFVLSRAGGLDMEKLTVEFEADVDLSTVGPSPSGKTVTPETKVGVEFRRGLLRRHTSVKVSACFRMGEPPEASELVADKLNEHLRIAISAAQMEENDG